MSKLLLGAAVHAFAADRVGFADGNALAADAVVLATGMAAAPFVAELPGARDGLGRVIVDTTRRSPAGPEVFVSAAPRPANTGGGHRTLQSCQHAGQLGRVAGENAGAICFTCRTWPTGNWRYVTCLDLGRSGAVITQGWGSRRPAARARR